MRPDAERALLLLAALAGLLGCDAADVPVFSAPSTSTSGTGGVPSNGGSAGVAGTMSGGAGTGGSTFAGQGGDIAVGGGDTACMGNADCADTFFCQTESCTRGARGVCVVKQPLCDSTLKPVCGCDHVTYWNDCLREEYGVSASTEGPCAVGARACRANTDCQGPPGATCAHLLPPGVGCGTSADQGTCWVTPSDCSTTSDSRKWQSCPPPNSGGGLGPCICTCEAVRLGHPSVQADSTSCP